MTTHNFTVIIADDHSLFADGLEQILASMDNFKVIAKVVHGKELIQTLNRQVPDLILLDINMPFMNGIDAAKVIRERRPEIKIVFLSMYYDTTMATRYKQLIDGFIVKDTTAPILKEAIMNVMKGQQVFISPVQQGLPVTAGMQDNFANKYKLTPREIEIIKLIKKGKSNKQMADELDLSNYTIETHRKNIYRKLNIKGIGELISFASSNNI